MPQDPGDSMWNANNRRKSWVVNSNGCSEHKSWQRRYAYQKEHTKHALNSCLEEKKRNVIYFDCEFSTTNQTIPLTNSAAFQMCRTSTLLSIYCQIFISFHVLDFLCIETIIKKENETWMNSTAWILMRNYIYSTLNIFLLSKSTSSN